MEIASSFIYKNVYPIVNDVVKNNLTKDFKTSIQELAQAEFDVTPTYDVISDE
ncbi:hypothetical protein GW891_00430 [bacterium]|nr:hypothetical protein [bacterium]